VSIELGYPELMGRTLWHEDKNGPHRAAATVDAGGSSENILKCSHDRTEELKPRNTQKDKTEIKLSTGRKALYRRDGF